MDTRVIKKLGIAPSRLVKTNFLGNWSSAFKGHGVTFADIRPYSRGDPWKRIDRITTAKKNELHIKEYEEERQLKIMCGIDIGESMNFTTTGTSKAEKAKEVCHLFAYAALALGDQIGGCTFDDHVSNYIRPTRGVQHITTFDKALDVLSPSNSSLDCLVKTLTTMNTQHTLLAVICDDFVDVTHSLLRGLAARNELLFFHLLDPFEKSLDGNMEHGFLGQKKGRYVMMTKKQKEQYRKRFEEKRILTQQLITKWGGSYCELLTSDDTMITLLQFFAKRAKMRR